MSKLTTQAVKSLMESCLGREDTLRVDGIVGYYMLNEEKLKEHRQEIIELLRELPEAFWVTEDSAGASFLRAALDKHGNHWAEHPTIDMLFALGQGIGFVGYVMPREMWCLFPGGMPYLYIEDPE